VLLSALFEAIACPTTAQKANAGVQKSLNSTYLEKNQYAIEKNY
jgi:hypothetical protein